MPEPFDPGGHYGGYHIGLYQPMLNRFLFSMNNIQHARDIALIASGRYPLFLVNFVTAHNYYDQMIDNHCCDNWKLPDEQIAPTKIRDYANFIIRAQHLLPVISPSDPALIEEKYYLQLCWHYLKLLDQLKNYNVWGWRVKQFMSDTFDLQGNQHDDTLTHIQNLRKQVIAELYLCKDTKATKASIENLISKAKKDHDLVS